MPAKKGSTRPAGRVDKKTPKKRVVKKVTKKKGTKKKAVKKDIEQAAARIPDMIVEEATQTPPPQKPRLPQQYHHHSGGQRRVMWVGVTVIAVVVCAMWLLNVRSSIETAYDDGAESSLLKNTSADFRTLLDQLEPEEEGESLQEAIDEELRDSGTIKEVINGTLSTLLEQDIITTSTTSTTSTADTAVTTTEDGTDNDTTE